jgi:hypothetical protein
MGGAERAGQSRPSKNALGTIHTSGKCVFATFMKERIDLSLTKSLEKVRLTRKGAAKFLEEIIR